MSPKSIFGKKQIPAPSLQRDLTGDRDLEWGFVAARLSELGGVGKNVLDFGCGNGLLSIAAATTGATVLAVDLLPRDFSVSHPNVTFIEGDVMDVQKDPGFDLIINCSTLEHVGLAGRYNSRAAVDGDIDAMQHLWKLLVRGGHMLLTMPIGQDSVFPPLHRVYGMRRLPLLTSGFNVLEDQYWSKHESNKWQPCTIHEAMADTPSERYYAIGMMVLKKGE